MGKKVYAIKEGFNFTTNEKVENIIVNTWAECLKYVKGVKGAKYKSFEDINEAKKFLEEGSKLLKKGIDKYPEDCLHIYVDGSYSISTEKYSYGLVAVRDNIVEYIESIKKKVIHAITVDDLNHLKRGGRISGTVAAVGGLLGIKPTLKIDDDGKVIPGDKIKGRKKALKSLVQQLKEKAINPEDQVVFICHADCLEDAEDVKRMILDEVKVKDVIINSIGAVIGTHGGPGTLGVVFIGNER